MPANAYHDSRTNEHRRYLSERLRERLTALQMTQSDLARKIDTSRDNVSGWARGTVFPRPSILKQLADALDCRVEDLVPSELAPTSTIPGSRAPHLNMQCDKDGNCVLTVNMQLPIHHAVEIMAIIQKITKAG